MTSYCSMTESIGVSMAPSRFGVSGYSQLHSLNQRREVLAAKHFYLPWLVANWLPPAGEPRQQLRSKVGQVSARHVSHTLLTPLFFSSSGVAPTVSTRPVEKSGSGLKEGAECRGRNARNSIDFLSIVGSSLPPQLAVGMAAPIPPRVSTQRCDRVCAPRRDSSALTIKGTQDSFDAEQARRELKLGPNRQQTLGTEQQMPINNGKVWDPAAKERGPEAGKAPTSAACIAGRGNGETQEIKDAGARSTDRDEDWSCFLPDRDEPPAPSGALDSTATMPIHVLRYCHELLSSPVLPATGDAVKAANIPWEARQVHGGSCSPRWGQQRLDGGQHVISSLEDGFWWETAGSTRATISTITPRSLACCLGDGNEQASETRDAGTSSAGLAEDWPPSLPSQEASPPPRVSAESAAPIPLHVLRYCRDLVVSPGSPMHEGLVEDKTTCWEEGGVKQKRPSSWAGKRRTEQPQQAYSEEEGESWKAQVAPADAAVSTIPSRPVVASTGAELTGADACSSEYDDEHHAFLRGQEVKFSLQASYLTGPNRPGLVNPAQRAALVDWLTKLHELAPKACEGAPLSFESLFLAVNVMDRFLSTAEGALMASRGDSALKFVAAAALSLASKYEEIDPPSLWAITVASKLGNEARSDGRHRADCSCALMDGFSFEEGPGGARASCTCSIRETRKELAAVETCVASALEFRMAAPTALSFLGIFMRRAQDLGYLDASVVEEVRAEATETLLSALRDASWLNHLPSAQAAAAIFWALCVSPHVCIVDGAVASFALLAVTGYERDKLQRCLSNMIYNRSARQEKGQDWMCGVYGMAGSDAVGEAPRFNTLENGFSAEVGSFRETVSPLIDVSPEASSDSLFSFSFFGAGAGRRTIAAL